MSPLHVVVVGQHPERRRVAPGCPISLRIGAKAGSQRFLFCLAGLVERKTERKRRSNKSLR